MSSQPQFILMRDGQAVSSDSVIDVARVESRILGHNFVGSEHVLCALVGLSDSKLRQLFVQRDADVERVRDKVIKIDTLGANQEWHLARPMTPRLQQIIPIAEAEATRFSHLTLPQSLLLGILIESQGVAVRVLKLLKFDLEQMKDYLVKP
jgi:ATP-dependent Clp protease ATP-binding subunit ClpA